MDCSLAVKAGTASAFRTTNNIPAFVAYCQDSSMTSDESTSQKNEPVTFEAELINNAVFAYFEILFRFFLTPCLGILAIVFNIVNIIVFVKMGVSGGVIQSFFILALSDCFIACCSVVLSFAYISESILRSQTGSPDMSAVHAQTVFWFAYYVSVYPHEVSVITTVVIALVRCFCVAMPLKVKAVLTTRRQLAAILVPSAIFLCIFIYACHSIQVIHVFDPQTNNTYTGLYDADWLTLALSQSFLSISAFITVIVCVVILTMSLRRSSTFRASSNSGQLNSTSANSGQFSSASANSGKFSSASANSGQLSSASTNSGQLSSTSTNSGQLSFATEISSQLRSVSSPLGKELGSKLTRKEQRKEDRVVKTVVMLCVAFIICTMPGIVYMILHLVVPGFEPRGRYNNENVVTLMLVESMLLTSTVVNIIIYYFYNTKYGETLRAIFRPN